MQSANGEYSYNAVYNGLTMHGLVNKLHERNCLINNWNFKQLKPGYGYDNLVLCIGDYFKANKDMCLENVAILVHNT